MLMWNWIAQSSPKEMISAISLLTLLPIILAECQELNYPTSFLRDSIERVTNYPFRTPPLQFEPFQPISEKRSYLRDHVFGKFGNRNLPIREAVESLPTPLLTGETRSFSQSGRIPLRDAVEHRTNVEFFSAVSRKSKIYKFDIEYPYYVNYDPTRHQILPNYNTAYRRPSPSPFFQFERNQPLKNNSEITFNFLIPEGESNNIQKLPPYPPPPQPLRSLSNFLRSPVRISNQVGQINNEHDDQDAYDKQSNKLVCYLQGWANHRKEPLKFNSNKIDPFACTHLIYAYAGIDPHTFGIYPQNEEHDIVQGGYRSVVGLKRLNPDLKVLISVAGWSTGESKFSRMVSSATRRQKFVKSIAKFLDTYNFDGVDLDWEFPGAEDLGGNKNDREFFSLLLEELAEVFLLRNWILSASVSPSKFRVDDGYNVKEIASHLDLINVLAFDLHSEREDVADHHSPLYRRKHDQGLDIFYNADYAIQYWIKKGAPREKLMLGIPFFGRSFSLANPEKWEPGSEIKGLGNEGPFTQDDGFLGYFEICEMFTQSNWKKNKDSSDNPYAVKGDQWIGYDDTKSVSRKVNYAKRQHLGGVALYAIDLDDYQGICGIKWPLLNTIRTELLKPLNQELLSPRPPILSQTQEKPQTPNVPVPGLVLPQADKIPCSGQGYSPDTIDCSIYHRCEWGWKTSYKCPEFLHFDKNLGLCNWPEAARCQMREYIKEDDVHRRSLEDGDEVKIVCYFTNWAWYRKMDGKFVPEHIEPRLCTHIVYSYASLDPNEFKLKPFDVNADIDNNFYDRITRLGSLRNQGKKTKVLLAVGGWTDSAGDKYSKMVSDEGKRKDFVKSSIEFLKRYRFSGLHLDWVYPKCWQSNCNKGPDSDMENFSKLLKELNKEFKKQQPSLTLAAAISGYREVIDAGYDMASISRVVDFMSIMTYDYHGAWEKRTGHISPLYYRSGDSFPRFNTNYTMEYLVAKGADRSKLLVGIPFYGQSFTLKDEKNSGYGAPAEGPGTPGEFTKQPGMLAYYEICHNGKKKWKVMRDSQGATGPFAVRGTQWVSYEDVKSVKEKSRYIRNMGYGGAMVWSVDLDDFNNKCCQGSFPLLKTVGRMLGHIMDEEVAHADCTRPTPPVTPPPPVTTTGFDTGSGMTTEHEHVHTTKPSWTESPTTGKPEWKPPHTTTTTRRPTTTTNESSTTKRPTTPSTATEGTRDPPTRPPENCDPGKYYPDSNNCNAFYRRVTTCILGELKKQYCVVGLHWNADSNVCDWPENAKCDTEQYVNYPAIPETTTKPPSDWWNPETTSPAVTTTTMVPPSTSCVNGAYYPVPGFCNLFNICVNDHLVTQTCAHGLHWNQQQQICDWSDNVPCKSNINKFGNDIDTVDIDLNLLSQPCQEGMYSNYPGSCTQYMVCMWGTYAMFSCPPDLHWNNEEKICDWPHRVNCKPSKPTTEEPDPEDENEITGGEDENENEEEDEDDDEDEGLITEAPVHPPTVMPPSERPTSIKPPSLAHENHFKIICYFTNWAWYRQGDGKYLPENIDPNLCTHLVYGFAVLDYEKLIIKAHDSWADFDNKFYERVVAYKKKGLKVTLAIGGWNDSQGNKYSRLVNSPSSRKKFISHVIQFLQKYDFDGLDLDWEYPKCWQVDCNKGPDSDKPAFAALVRELHEAFKPQGLLLSAAVSPSKTVIDAGYDVGSLGQYLDWVSVMTYDYHGQWDKKTGHVAPMYYHDDDEFYFFNANFSINYWISQGVSTRKLIMGMPLYGQSFQLENPKSNGLNAKASGPGQAGEFTKAAGFLSFYEICDKIQNKGWKVVKSPQKIMGPYTYKGNQWVSFDDVDMIKEKSEYIRKMNLGGAMIWALDLDDFNDRCGKGKYPLLSAIKNVLASPPSDSDMMTNPPPEAPPFGGVTKPTRPPNGQQTSTTDRPTDVTSGKPPSDEQFKVICYFTNWAWYRQGLGKYLPSDIDPDLCTHIIYGFAVLNSDQGIIKPHDTWADFDNKFYEKVTKFKKKGIKVLIAIGGWNDSAGDKYSRLVNNPTARSKFIAHVIEFIERHNFDGLDLDWEYPKCWQVNCEMGPDSDKSAFAAFVRELRTAFNPRGLLLSAAVSPSKRVMDAGYDIATLTQNLDWISVMTYDFHGQWDKKTGHVAPMYLHADDFDVTFHANFSINYWINEGADRKKIVMGLPMYGQSFSLANAQMNGLNSPTYGGGEAGEFTRARGFMSYYEICHNVREKKWKMVRDRKGRMGPYAYLRDQWVSFDDQEMIKHKAEYIRYMGLGGGMIWALDLDDFRNRCQCESYPLLKTINRILRNYPGPQPICVLDGNENQIMPERPGFGETPPPTSSELPWEEEAEESDTEKPTKRPTTTIRPTKRPTTTQGPARPTSPTTHMPGIVDTSDCKGHLFVPHPNCNKYYICIHGRLREMNCPQGLHWNTDHCDWPANSRCKPSVPDEELHTTTTDDNEETWMTTQRPTWTTLTVRPTISTTEAESESVEETSEPPPVNSNSEYKVVCYFTNWAWYRPGIGKYSPENIDYDLCTHIAYGFAVLDPNTLTIKPHDSWADIDNEFYLKVTRLKKKGLKVLIAIGGWNDSLGNKYSRLVASSSRRRKFIETVLQFISKYNFDGLDLDWEYPKCWQVNCNAGPSEDKQNFATFVMELSKAFKPKGLLLSSAVSPSKIVIDLGYEVAKLSHYFDYISVMTYDFHGHWDKMTGHVAPLYYNTGDTYDYFNANYSINYWIEKGADRRKIIMGMPLYGQSFQLQNPKEHGLNAPSSGPGRPGEFTRAGGFLSFYEICEYVKRQGWKVVRNSMKKMGPYAYKGNQWVSYDDVSDIRQKSRFIKQMNLGGGMVWALDLDDFRNTCGCGSHPLLKTLNQELRGVGGRISDCT
ncbi:hypothetical protein RUM44_002775 [Polyplax serrata]|uniref:Chitinase n=1 Tax=Polyplax serrata TaxID=468196 RepID=A0ABR1AFQ2_POLSC